MGVGRVLSRKALLERLPSPRARRLPRGGKALQREDVGRPFVGAIRQNFRGNLGFEIAGDAGHRADATGGPRSVPLVNR